MAPNTWNDACAQALAELRTMEELNPIPSDNWNQVRAGYEAMTAGLSDYVQFVQFQKPVTAVGYICNAAVLAIRTLKSLGHTVDYTDLYNLLCRKQHDYGHQNIDNFGLVGVVVRICDKIARAINLEGRLNSVKDETIIDTYTDIIGYAVIALMLDADTFRLELEDRDYVR